MKQNGDHCRMKCDLWPTLRVQHKLSKVFTSDCSYHIVRKSHSLLHDLHCYNDLNILYSQQILKEGKTCVYIFKYRSFFFAFVSTHFILMNKNRHLGYVYGTKMISIMLTESKNPFWSYLCLNLQNLMDLR